MKKLKNRWNEAGDHRWNDYFYKVPWWLRIKRFLYEDRTREQQYRQAEEDWKEDEYERGGK